MNRFIEGADEGIFAATSCPDCGHEVYKEVLR